MRIGDDLVEYGDEVEAREGVDLAAAHLSARAVQRRVVAICAVCMLIGVAVLGGAIVSAGLTTPGPAIGNVAAGGNG